MIQVQVTTRRKLKNQIVIENVNHYQIVMVNKLFFITPYSKQTQKNYINLLVKYVENTESTDDEVVNDRQVKF